MNLWFASLCLALSFPVMATDGTITISGQIIAPQDISQLTDVKQENGQYVLYSRVTGERLATFSSMSALQRFVVGMSQAVAYRNPTP